MENTYVKNHKWGSFEKNATINKLELRNKEDLIAYLEMIIPIVFEIKDYTNNVIEFEDNTKYQIEIK